MKSIRINHHEDLKDLQSRMLRNGYVKIENMFRKEHLENLKKRIQSSEEYINYTSKENQENIKSQPNTSKSIKISSVHYRNEGTMLIDTLDMMQKDPLFAEIMTTITQKELLRTNDHVFEIACNTYPGLNWHVGYYSFSYIPIEDYACTLWIPLDPITEEQRGGMEYIETNTLNGRFIYPFASWHFDKLQAIEPSQEYKDETISDKHMVNAITGMIDHSVPKDKINEDQFKVGDVFLFDKDVLHKTSPFLEGKLKTRMALVIRFVDRSARFDKKRLEGIFQ